LKEKEFGNQDKEIFMREIIIKIKNMGMEFTDGKMVLYTRVSLRMVIK
jgi:hypothetical protein